MASTTYTSEFIFFIQSAYYETTCRDKGLKIKRRVVAAYE